MSTKDWTRFPTDEMSLRLLIEACQINEDTGQTHLQDFLDMGHEPISETDISDEFDVDVPVFLVEYEDGQEPHSEHTVIISLAEEILRLRGETENTDA